MAMLCVHGEESEERLIMESVLLLNWSLDFSLGERHGMDSIFLWTLFFNVLDSIFQCS